MSDAEVDDQDERPGGEPAQQRSRWPLVLGSVVGLYAVGLVVLGGEEALEAITSAAPLFLLGALCCQALVVLLWPLVHRASLRAVGQDLAYRHVLPVSMSVFSVSRTAPMGGAVGAAVGVDRFTRYGIRGPAATGAAFLTGPLALTTIVLLGTLGVTLAVLTGQLGPSYLVVAALGLLVLVAVMVVIVRALHSPTVGDRVIDALARSERLRERTEEWRVSWREVTSNAPSVGGIARIMALSFVKWTADMASLALVFLAFGETPQLTVLLIGFGVTQIATTLPTTPGSIGIAEGGLVGAFVALGIPVALGTTVAITYRMLETWLPTAAGIPVLVRTGNGRGGR